MYRGSRIDKATSIPYICGGWLLWLFKPIKHDEDVLWSITPWVWRMIGQNRELLVASTEEEGDNVSE